MFLYANRDFAAENDARISRPHIVLRGQYPLREIIDEIGCMLRDGYVFAKYSNNEEIAPLESLSFSVLNHYWFGPTQKGTEAWSAYKEQTTEGNDKSL